MLTQHLTSTKIASLPAYSGSALPQPTQLASPALSPHIPPATLTQHFNRLLVHLLCGSEPPQQIQLPLLTTTLNITCKNTHQALQLPPPPYLLCQCPDTAPLPSIYLPQHSPSTFTASLSASIVAVICSHRGVTLARSVKRMSAGAGPELGTSAGSPPYRRRMMCAQSVRACNGGAAQGSMVSGGMMNSQGCVLLREPQIQLPQHRKRRSKRKTHMGCLMCNTMTYHVYCARPKLAIQCTFGSAVMLASPCVANSALSLLPRCCQAHPYRPLCTPTWMLRHDVACVARWQGQQAGHRRVVEQGNKRTHTSPCTPATASKCAPRANMAGTNAQKCPAALFSCFGIELSTCTIACFGSSEGTDVPPGTCTHYLHPTHSQLPHPLTHNHPAPAPPPPNCPYA